MHLFNSLVRVSRRVGGAADLLATEMQAVTENHSLYEPALLPVDAGARKAGLGELSPELHPPPRSSPNGSLREREEKYSHREATSAQGVLADHTSTKAPHESLNLLPRLREHLRLPLYSFTYS